MAGFQAIQWMIADSTTELEAARLLLMNAAYQKERGRPFTREAAMVTLYATESANGLLQRAADARRLRLLPGSGA